MSSAVSSPDSERAGLREFLDYQRDALIEKVQGLSEEQARSTPTASSLSLLGLVKHSTVWERRWFEVIVAGRVTQGEWPEVRPTGRDVTFDLADGDTIERVVAEYLTQIEISNEILETVDLEAPCQFAGMADKNLRFVALHMVEETARHAGHADIIRETIDALHP